MKNLQNFFSTRARSRSDERQELAQPDKDLTLSDASRVGTDARVTLDIVIYGADQLPIADLLTNSSDPYVIVGVAESKARSKTVRGSNPPSQPVPNGISRDLSLRDTRI